MPRYRLTIEYDGTNFTGWQSQPGMPTVQGAIEAAFHRFTGESVFVRGAGRTDSGVHALGQVAHVDLEHGRPALKIREALNFHLKPAPIAIIACEDAAPDFDARFSATSRHYRYRILTRRAPPALDFDRVWHIPIALDAAVMHEAAQTILGRHDFTTFRASACQARSAIRTLDQLDVATVGDEIHVTASARSFLHNQVRSMVGSLKVVGQGKWRPRDLLRALEARDRAACGVVAPPSGLYLVRVRYQLNGAAPGETSTVEDDDD
jgi:tRNA pseudouridine38-40 synthase